MKNADGITELDLHAYFDGELDAPRKQAVEAWLVDHPDDAERIAGWAGQGELIRGAFDPVLEEPLPTGLVAAARRRRSFALARGVLAASVIFGAGFLTAWTVLENSPGAENGFVAAGLAAHGLYIPESIHAVEVAATEKPHLEKWLTKRIGAPVVAPELGPEGLELLGGRVVPVMGKAGALLMYQSGDGARFTLLIANVPSHVKATEYRQAGQYGAVAWGNNGYSYVLSGPAGAGRLQAVRDAVAAGLPNPS